MKHVANTLAMLGLVIFSSGSHADPVNGLGVNGRLDTNQSITSPSGRVRLIMQPDCNLVAYQQPKNSAYWSSGTADKGSSCSARMQVDGNFVVYDKSNKALWASGSAGHPGATLGLNDDGNVVLGIGTRVIWAANKFADQPFTSCVPAGSADVARSCYVFQPDVQHPETAYQAIRFNPGDTIRVDAQGCVQTGGAGATWKDYVNPQGDNSGRLYHGQIMIPGVVPQLSPVSSFNGKTLEFPGNVDPRVAYLTLGYVDDKYSDNGYDKHDDGSNGQCSGKGPASVKLTITPGGTNITISPKFQVLTVVYAPPGCTSTTALKCGATSSVDYGTGSTTGTKVSASQSFKADNTVTVSTGVANVDGGSASAGFSWTNSGSNTETVSKSAGYDLKVIGNQDGVDHDYDQIVVLLNPDVAVRAAGNNIQWFAGYTSNAAFVQALPVIWLKHRPALPCNNAAPTPNDQMPCSIATELQKHGFNDVDYAAVLARDPFANGSTALSARYVPTAYSLAYEPANQSADCNGSVCTCPQTTITLKNETDGDTGQQYQDSFSVGLEGSVGPLAFAVKDSLNFTWTNSSSLDYTTVANQTSTLSMTCASPSYNGKPFMQVYWDTVYSSFLFVPVDLPDDQVMAKGTVLNKEGKPAVGQAVDLTLANGKVFHTTTDRQGMYRIPKPKAPTNLAGTAQLRAGGASKTIPLGSQVLQNMSAI